MAGKWMPPGQQCLVSGDEDESMMDGRSRDEAIGRIFVQTFKLRRQNDDRSINRMFIHTGFEQACPPIRG